MVLQGSVLINGTKEFRTKNQTKMEESHVLRNPYNNAFERFPLSSARNHSFDLLRRSPDKKLSGSTDIGLKSIHPSRASEANEAWV